jgi:hypothetical protein
MARTGSVTAHHLAAAIALLATLALLCACAKRSPTEPRDNGVHTLSGRVRLVGQLTEFDGTFAGTRVTDDANGVPVELLYGSEVLARTLTVNGVYTFTGLRSGAYKARSTVVGKIYDETVTLTVNGGDLFASDAVELRSFGDIFAAPNPSSSLVLLSFDVPDSQFVSLKIRDLQGNIVQSLYGQWLPRGRYDAAWTGYDLNNQPATAPYYWVTFESGADTRAQLLFR